MRAFLLVLALMGCSCIALYTSRNPASGKQIRWPQGWSPERGPEVRGGAVSAIHAALEHHLRIRSKTHPVNFWEEPRCEDTARAMAVSYMEDDEQSLVFVQIDEVPEKRCPNPPPLLTTDAEGRPAIIVRRPIAPMVLDGLSRYAVTPDGQVLDAYLQVGSGSQLDIEDAGTTRSGMIPADGG